MVVNSCVVGGRSGRPNTSLGVIDGTSLFGRDSCRLDRRVFLLLLFVVVILFLVVSPLVLLSQAMGIAELFASFSLFPRLLVSTTFLAPVGRSDFVPAPVVNVVLVPTPVAKLDVGSFEFGWVLVRVVAQVFLHFVRLVPTIGHFLPGL